MTAGVAAMLAGVFVVPAVLLWAGHRLRRRSEPWRAAFWGAVVAHVVLLPAATVAALYPAAEWSGADTLRGAVGFWAMLLGPAAGAAIAWAIARRATYSRAASRPPSARTR